MKLLVVAMLVACACATNPDQDAKIIRSDFEQAPEGGYQYAFETENGISGQASGVVKQFGKDEVAIEVKGSNQYTDPEGRLVQLSYIADENGYQPQGDHLPTPPPAQPIPDYIARSLQYIKEHPYVEKKQ